jgi:hypothetical protein
MFEETQKNNNLNSAPVYNPAGGIPPAFSANKPAGQVEDIFAGAEKSSFPQATKPSVFEPKTPSLNNAAMLGAGDNKKEKIKKIIIAGISVLALLIIIFGGGWYAYAKFFSKSAVPVDLNNQAANNLEEEQKTENNTENAVGEIKEPEAISPRGDNNENIGGGEINQVIQPEDSDLDGLSDEEEIKLGTDINNADSDNDNLFDREEAVVYKTDPLNSDTDGDKYSDGQEVQGGYNPKGAGKLYEITR